MKIVANINRYKFLVEANEDELARICGYDSQSQRERQASKKFDVGVVIEIDSLFSKFHEIQRQRKRLIEIKNEAEAVIMSCEKINSITKKIAQYPEEEK